MTALNSRTHRRLGTDAARTATDGRAESDAIFGTWDFKWPRGSKIRVAFQFPRWLQSSKASDRATFAGIVETIHSTARLWLEGTTAVSFDWLSPGQLTFAEGSGQSDASTRLIPELSSQEASFGRSTYDVLVSLDRFTLDGQPSTEGTAYALPSAELGTYNRRCNYGEPTVYLGPLGIWPGEPGEFFQPPSATDDLRRLARFHVLHEFGHVLGLVHTHQDPEWRRKNSTDWARDARMPERLRGILETRLGLKPAFVREHLETFAESHIVKHWPGNPDYSDWRTDQRADDNSTMFVPFMHCLHSDSDEVPEVCPACLAALAQQPSSGDLMLVRQIYANANS